jgi:hypothetical protein
VVYISSRIYDAVDDNGNASMICCGVEREEIYMGGGLWVYKCHTCGSRMETNVK